MTPNRQEIAVSRPSKPLARHLGREGEQRRWKRTWKRPGPGRRAAAAAAMQDLFVPRKVPTAVWVVVVISLLAHVALLPFLASARGKSLDEMAKTSVYLQKVMEKETAKKVAGKMVGRLTMPPPPPDPQGVVENALSESLAGDVTKVTAGLLPVNLQQELAGYVKRNLKDELDAASKEIAAGKLTEEEIRQRHRKFQDMAHKATLEWRDEYLKEHQVERASMSTTEWYEKDVSKTLFRNISFELWTPPGYNSHPPSPELWHHAFTGAYGWEQYLNWSDLRSDGMLREKIGRLNGLLSGKWSNAGGRGVDQHPAWPGPSAEQADIIQARLKETYDGRPTVTYPYPSWKVVVTGQDVPKMTSGVLREFHPHRLDQAQKLAAQCEDLWTKLLPQADDYQQQAQNGAADGQLKAAQAACFGTMKELTQAAAGLTTSQPDQCRQVNWALRIQMLLSPLRDDMYKLWVDEMVAGLAPLVRDFAKGQFKKGIIVHKDGVDQAMKEFPAQIVPLLRRDIERMLPAKRFYSRSFGAVYGLRGYTSSVTGQPRDPDDKDLQAELAEMNKVLAAWPQVERAYADKRKALLEEDFAQAVRNVREAVLERVLTGNLLLRQMDLFVEGVDYSDKVQEKLNARQMALQGRGQDLARLTEEGVPDTSAPMIALLLGASKGHGANLEPVSTLLEPAVVTLANPPEAALQSDVPKLPPLPAKWGMEEQATVKPAFQNGPRFEGIPYLVKFPALDGNLSDWGKIRPLMLRRGGTEDSILVYAAWNYQGFFFGYQVNQDQERFYYPSMWGMSFNHNTGGVWFTRVGGVDWAYRGDYLRLMFDTLDARNRNRGEPHTQEFVVFPLGIESDPTVPGIERLIQSQRDATAKEYRGVKASGSVYRPQPGEGPDGTGPYRITRADKAGYTTEVFLPRSLFKVPIVAPGWYIGFDCAVGVGAQPGNNQFRGQTWASGLADSPDRWGDLLLLGTDPRIVVQEADAGGSIASAVIPGYSYLLTVIDPDRNVNPSTEDTVLVSAEVKGGNNDVEVFVLKETEKNNGTFRGYINTQPGAGRQVQGVLELMPLEEVVLGYVDFGNAKGQRNVVTEVRLPVVAPVTTVAHGNGRH